MRLQQLLLQETLALRQEATTGAAAVPVPEQEATAMKQAMQATMMMRMTRWALAINCGLHSMAQAMTAATVLATAAALNLQPLPRQPSRAHAKRSWRACRMKMSSFTALSPTFNLFATRRLRQEKRLLLLIPLRTSRMLRVFGVCCEFACSVYKPFGSSTYSP